jgi:DNA-directed RNA polymerase specialized sigma24 family protein
MDQQGEQGRESESAEFQRLASERDLYAAYALLCKRRDLLGEHLMRRYGRALGGQVEVEWVVEEAIERARDWAFRFDGSRGSLARWLEKIGENCARNALERGRRRVPLEGGAEVAPSRSEELPLAELRAAVAGLPRVDRLIVQARYRERAFPDARLSRWLGWTVGHIQNRRSRALRLLRERMGNDDGS